MSSLRAAVAVGSAAVALAVLIIGRRRRRAAGRAVSRVIGRDVVVRVGVGGGARAAFVVVRAIGRAAGRAPAGKLPHFDGYKRLAPLPPPHASRPAR